MRILLTGGAGFLGSHLCGRLLDMGHEVLCVDNLYTGSRDNLAVYRENKNLTVIEQDICDPFEAEVDFVMNFACPAAPIHYQKNPIQTLKTNVIGTINLLEVCRKLNVPFLQASTSEVYGDPEVHPQTEEYWGKVNPIGVRSCYDEGKRCAETLTYDYSREYGIDTRVIRIFNTYGPRMARNDGRVVGNFILQAISGEPLTIYGNGSQTRSFCYVEDLIDGIIAVMNYPELIIAPINLGNPQEMTMLELARSVIEVTGSKSRIIFKELPEDDPKQRKPDIARAKQLLNWEPRWSLEDGIRETANYFKSLPK